MNERKAQRASIDQSRGRGEGAPRRPYEPPAIEESSEFETLALTCGKVGGLTCYYGGGYRFS